MVLQNIYLANIEAHMIADPRWFVTVFQEIHNSLFDVGLRVCDDTALHALGGLDRTLRCLASHNACTEHNVNVMI